MQRLALTLITMLVLTATGSVAVGQIYKWTDEEGNVHFTDKPVDGEAECVAIRSRRTDPGRVQASVEARAEAAAKKTEEKAAVASQGPTEEELAAQAAERAKKCATYRERLQRFVQSRRIYREDENGERVYLSEEEMQEARERVENQVQEYCDS